MCATQPVSLTHLILLCKCTTLFLDSFSVRSKYNDYTRSKGTYVVAFEILSSSVENLTFKLCPVFSPKIL